MNVRQRLEYELDSFLSLSRFLVDADFFKQILDWCKD